MSDAIRIWNRREKREETELVYGDLGVRLLYGTAPGFALADGLLARKWISRVYGALQSSALSRAKVEPFVRKFGIRMDEYEPGPFASFNDFFIRKFVPGARAFESSATRMAAPAEARYLAYERVSIDQVFPVKGAHLTPAVLLGSEEKARPFEGGSLLIARLCPVDYHRYHYPDSGKTAEFYTVAGKLHSVNPLALKRSSEIFATNERRVSLLETDHLGRMAYIEVGALCVGKIVQTHPEPGRFERGAEKGYFLFGASTVIVLGEKGAWRPDADLLEQTAQRRETYIRLGDGIAGADA